MRIPRDDGQLAQLQRHAPRALRRESSRAACRAWCCGQGERCNAYVWHVGAGQCWVSPSPVDPVAQCSRTHGDPPAWVGEPRQPGRLPPPPQPPRLLLCGSDVPDHDVLLSAAQPWVSVFMVDVGRSLGETAQKLRWYSERAAADKQQQQRTSVNREKSVA